MGFLFSIDSFPFDKLLLTLKKQKSRIWNDGTFKREGTLCLWECNRRIPRDSHRLKVYLQFKLYLHYCSRKYLENVKITELNYVKPKKYIKIVTDVKHWVNKYVYKKYIKEYGFIFNNVWYLLNMKFGYVLYE